VEGEAQDELGLFLPRPRTCPAPAPNAAPSPVTAVYSLLREPSLALLWTHGYTFRVRPPSYVGILPLNRDLNTPGTAVQLTHTCEELQRALQGIERLEKYRQQELGGQ
jgi:hypothetical protein